MSRSGRRAPSRRIVTGCARATWPPPSLMRCATARRRPVCSPTSISPWTARSSKRGPASRASRAGMPSGGRPDDPGNPDVDFRGERRSNATHASTTDPHAQLYKKANGQKSVMAYLGHVLMENRHGLIVNACATAATGTAEREAAEIMLRAGRRPRTLGADKNYDVASFVATLRAAGITPHVAQKIQYTAIDARTTRHPGYARSQRKRKLVEQAFGWMKTVGLMRKLRHRGGELVDWMFTFTATAYNLVRLRTLGVSC